MPAYYPVFLDVRDRRCVVVGGGELGEEKALRLLEYGAAVEVVSPEVTSRVRELAAGGRLTWTGRRYQSGDLYGAFVAIVADTEDSKMNRAVYDEAKARSVPLNVADVTHLCTWIAPAVVRRGDVVVAASTGGASPALARKMREELDGTGSVNSRHGVMEYADLAPLLADARSQLARRGIKLKGDHWQACLTDDLVDLVLADRSGEAAEVLMSCLLSGVDCGCENETCRMWEELVVVSGEGGASSAADEGATT